MELAFPEQGTVAMTPPRLVLRTYQTADLAPLVAVNADRRVMKILGGPRLGEA